LTPQTRNPLFRFTIELAVTWRSSGPERLGVPADPIEGEQPREFVFARQNVPGVPQ
jgi:hypothetical protein